MRRRLDLGVLGIREFRLLFIGQATSSFGDRLAPIALAFAVLDLTGSVSDLGYVLAAETVPMLLLVAFAGVWADRLPRQLVMLASDVVRMAAQGATAVLLLTHQAHLWQLLVLQATYGGASAFFSPAMVGLVPATVGAGRLQQANSLMSLSRSTVGIVGPAAGGALVALVSPGAALAIDAGTFAVSALSLGLLRLARLERERPREPVLTELREGWHEIRSRSWLLTMIVYFGFFNVAAFPAFFVLGPYIAKHSLGGASAWATILTAGAIGSVAGGLLSLRARPRRPLLSSEAPLVLVPVAAVLLAFHEPTLAIAAAWLAGAAALARGDAIWHTVVQQRIPEHAISRVSAIDWTGSLVMNPIGFAVVGPLAAGIGIRTTLIASAALTLAATIACMSVPSVRSLEALEEGPTLREAAEPTYAGVE
jgi:MFS family permease